MLSVFIISRMETHQEIAFSSAKQHNDFHFISFVSSSEEFVENIINSKCPPARTLNGEEASQFYNEIISTPSSSSFSEPSSSKEPFKKTVQRETFSKYSSSRLTIFHHAQDGNIEGIKYSLSKGCNIDIKDMFGWTPLMCATAEGLYTTVGYIIKCGANLSVKNKQGQTALDIAIDKNNCALIEILKNGVPKNMSNTENIKKEFIKYCDICFCSYKESTLSHKSSIAHLLNCKKRELSTFYHIPENNKGFQIMLKKGWDKNKGLGMNAKGRKFPIKTVLKNDRTCIGRKKEVAKVTHFGPNDYSSVKKHNQPAAKLVRLKTYKKREMLKIQRKKRQKEINFRRQFSME